MLISFLRTILLYGLLVVSVRLMGKRQIGEMEPAEFVVTMLLANLAAGPMQDVSLSLVSALVPILTVLALELILAAAALKAIRLRALLCGRPAILIAEGRVDQKALRENRVSLDELSEQLREKDVFDLKAVKYAILETDGELSVMPYPQYRPAPAKDAGVPVSEPELPYTLISDGRLMAENLSRSGFDRAWLDARLAEQKLRRKDVFLFTADRSGNTVLIRKEPK